MDAIRIDDLSKFYGKSRGVAGLNLSVAAGDLFGFIGPNGAGKSTTIRTLMGLIHPTAGRAEVLGLDCARDGVKLRARVGYMPSEANFYPGMRAGEVIRLSAKLRGKDCAAEARALCERLDLDAKKRVEQLSMGNRRKLSIVCAMQHRPEVYILDEPTSGLDPLMQKEFFELLAARRAEGATVFISSHVLSEVQRHCANAAIIREGRVIASGPVDELSRTSARRVSLRGVERAPAIPGVQRAEAVPGGVSFLYGGEMRALIAALNGLPIEDMTVAEIDLDEVFLHFYEGGEAK